jgi:putative transposase
LIEVNMPAVRKNIRLPDFDYHQAGIYFVTLCIHHHRSILWDLNPVGERSALSLNTKTLISDSDGSPIKCNLVGERSALPKNLPLSYIGEIVQNAILDIPSHYSNITIDNYVVMPNHVHLLIKNNLYSHKNNPVEECGGLPKENGKSNVSQMGSPTNDSEKTPSLSIIINQLKGAITKKIGIRIWQRSFYDHIIRNDQDYAAAWQYIELNPLKWEQDNYFTYESDEHSVMESSSTTKKMKG